MMRQFELVERVLTYDPTADEALLNKAYVYAMKAHGDQRRASGDPYFSHPLEVAAILTELKLGDATIATALLHDVIEDTETTKAEIDQLFGPEIGALVEGLTKIKKLDLVSKKAEQAENFRKLLVAISSDIRVLLVKLADRLHNMRTLEHKKPESRRRNSEETLEIYAPLAGRMGMQGIREELEALAFRWLHPDAHSAIVEKLARLRTKNEGLVEEIGRALRERLSQAGIDAEVVGREKKPYAIWRKIQAKQISLEQLSDIYGFRVVTESVADCYRAIGIAHTTWRTVPGRFKDYISTPKQNGYCSIHTTVIGPRHQRVELQIRTRDMHRIAEMGVAAHALYKDGVVASAGGVAPAGGNPYRWLRHLVETLLEGDNSEEFLEHTKLELFHDQVFSFTPKGDIIALPSGATPIDFAYAVHTDVGNRCVGAIVNGRQHSLASALRNGDEVQILTSEAQTPQAAWEKVAITGKARSAIRRAARDARRRQYAELGRRLLVSSFEKGGVEYTEEKVRRVLGRLAHRTVEDVLAAVGRSELPVGDVVRAVAPDARLVATPPARRPKNRFERGQNEEGWFNLTRVMGLKFRWPGSAAGANGGSEPAGSLEPDLVGRAGSVPIRGVRNDIPVTFEEGGAVPGDRIVGVLMADQGIRIFQISSPRLAEFEHERWIDVTWDLAEGRPERFPARVAVTAVNEPGSLARIAGIIAEADGNIDNLRMLRRGADFTDMLIEVEVWDLPHLSRIIAGLRSASVIAAAERSFD